MDSDKNSHKITLEDDDDEENRTVNDENPTRDEEEDEARLIIHTPPEININMEELRAAEVNVIPRQKNFDPVLHGIVDSRFEALFKREFTTDLTAEVRGYIQGVREHMEAVRAEMVSLRQENRILTGVTKTKHLVGNDPWINQLLINVIGNRQRLSRLEAENDTLTHENSAYREELSRIRREGCIRKDILNLDDRPKYREGSPSELEEAGVTMTRVIPLSSYSLAPDEAPPLKNRHMVPGNYTDTYEALGLPLPIGKLTHMVRFKPNVLGHTVDIKKIKLESPIVSSDEDNSSEEEGGDEEEEEEEEGEEEGSPAVSPGMNARLTAKQAEEHQSSSNADIMKGNKISEMPKVEKKPKQRSLSYQRPADICKVKSDIEARLASNTLPKTTKSNGKNINGVMLPPITITSAAPEETGATDKAARRKLKTPRQDIMDKHVKPPKKLVAMGLDCIKPSSRLVYQGSLPINTASSNVQSEQVKESDKLPTVSAKTSEKLEPPKNQKSQGQGRWLLLQ